MQESKRQKQVGKLIQEELSQIFLKESLTMMEGGMISIAEVSMTPDLLEARIYLSFFQIKNEQEVLNTFQNKAAELRGILGNNLRHHLRRIPELQFFLDKTLDEVFRLEKIFKEIKKED